MDLTGEGHEDVDEMYQTTFHSTLRLVRNAFAANREAQQNELREAVREQEILQSLNERLNGENRE
jgi:hypothetical protein